MLRGHRIILTIAIILIAAVLFLTGRFFYFNLRGVFPAIKKPPVDISQLILPGNNGADSEKDVSSSSDALVAYGPLSLPSGFSLEVFAKDLPSARVMAIDSSGNIWLSQTRQGVVSQLKIKDGKLESQKTIFSGLKNPHGLAFDPQDPNILYIAEETKISKVAIGPAAYGTPEEIIELPKGAGHFTRTLGFGPDGRLYVSIGSTCNVCNEKDDRYASIYSLKKDGSDWRQTAKGLRNSVFFTWNKRDGRMWATEMGRDLLGDDIPPDEINIIDTGAASTLNFGWPICYGGNIHDTVFDKNTYFRNPCQAPLELPSHIDLQAHSAPLGLAFVPGDSAWPEDYQGDLLVAFHGSWNRSEPTGYKVVRIILDEQDNFIRQEDFISGWLTADGALGRPVDLIFDSAEALYISDDKAGVIYKIAPFDYIRE
jgi:glucose/arabinose dehydrogenase